MKFVLWLMYTLKINMLHLIVSNSRLYSTTLQYIDDPIFATRCDCPEDYADKLFEFNNMTGIPII